MFERKMPFWEVAALVAEHLDRKTVARIKDACRRDLIGQTGRRIPKTQMDEFWTGRVEAAGWIAHYIWRGDNQGGIYLIARPEDEERQLDAIQLPVRNEGDLAHLELNLRRLEGRYFAGDDARQNSMIARAAQVCDVDFINNMQQIVEAEAFLDMDWGNYVIECDYEWWDACFWDTWLPQALRFRSGAANRESEARGLLIVKIAYARQHPVVRRPNAEDGREPSWSHWP
jgi:hypothetical protein